MLFTIVALDCQGGRALAACRWLVGTPKINAQPAPSRPSTFINRASSDRRHATPAVALTAPHPARVPWQPKIKGEGLVVFCVYL